MPTADKFKPVRQDPETESSVLPTLLAVYLVGAVMLAWMSPELVSWLQQRRELPAQAQLVEAATEFEAAVASTGMQSVRAGLHSVFDPMERTGRVFRAPPEPRQARVAVSPLEDGSWAPPAERTDRPLKVLMIGASSIEFYLGVELERMLEEVPGVEVHRHGKLGTGLTLDDQFDWQGTLERLLNEHEPDLVIAQFGGNDATTAEGPDGEPLKYGKPGWDERYIGKLRKLTRTIVAADALPVFIGMPNMREDWFARRMKHLNGLAEQLMAEEGGRYLSTWELTSDAKGAYRVQARWRERTRLMRMPDGIHFTRNGAQLASTTLIERLEREALFPPADMTLAASHRRVLTSAARQKDTVYLAYVPQEVPPEGLPAVLLLHGAWDSYKAWPEHAHRELQTLAEQHKVVLVLPDGEPFGWYLDSERVPGNLLETYIHSELLPDMRAWLPIDERVGIAGMSMGGHGALSLSMRRPGVFAAASSMSGAVDLVHAKSRKQLVELLGPYEENTLAWEARSAHHLLERYPERAKDLPILLSCGTEDTTWYPPNERLHALLEEKGVEHTWRPEAGAHTWEYWVSELPVHVAWQAEQLHRVPKP